MKRLSFLFSVVALAATSFLSSCGDKNEDPKPAPTISAAWVGASGNSISSAPTVSFNYTAATGEDLAEVSIVASYMTSSSVSSPLPTFPKTKSFTSNTSDTKTITYTVPTDATTDVTLTITVKDSKGASATTMLYIILPYTEMGGQFIYNVLGSQKGAYDLVNGMAKSSTDAAADKDLLDMTSNLTGIYDKGWSSGNGTKFVKASSSYSYATADKITAAAAYGAGTAVSTVTNVSVGDVYIAKLRGGNDYAVIKIVEVQDDNAVGVGNNEDYVKFDYKN